MAIQKKPAFPPVVGSGKAGRTNKGDADQAVSVAKVVAPKVVLRRGQAAVTEYCPGGPTAANDIMRLIGTSLPLPEAHLDTLKRLEPAIVAQVAALEKELTRSKVPPADFALAIVVEMGSPRAGHGARGDASSTQRDRLLDPQADALAVALEVARRVGHPVSVVAYDGERAVNLAGVDIHKRAFQGAVVVEKFLALKYGDKLSVSADTRAWLADVRDTGPRASAQAASAPPTRVGDALSLARAGLDGAACAHAGALLIQESVPAAGLAGVEELWSRDGLVGASIAAGPNAAAAGPKLFAAATVAADPAALVELVGLGRAQVLLGAVIARHEERVVALTDYRDRVREHAHEDKRLAADAWLAARVETTVSSDTTVEHRMVNQVYKDPLVFDLSGRGKLETQRIDGGLLISSRLDVRTAQTKTRVTKREGETMHLWDRTYETTRTTTIKTLHQTRFAEWLCKDAGVLVFDRGKDGIQAADLFGDGAVTGREAKNGFDDLRSHDKNKDGVIDAKDAVFKDLKIWRDLDGDGKPGPGELFTLQQAGIAAIRLGFRETGDATFRQQGTFKSTRAVELEDEIAALPAAAKKKANIDVTFGASGGGAGTSVVGSAVLTGAGLDREIKRARAKLADLRRELAALDARAGTD